MELDWIRKGNELDSNLIGDSRSKGDGGSRLAVQSIVDLGMIKWHEWDVQSRGPASGHELAAQLGIRLRRRFCQETKILRTSMTYAGND